MAPIWTDATAPFASRPLMSTLSGEVTLSHMLAPVSSHCFAWVATTADGRLKSPATKRIASTVCPLAMVNVLAPSSAPRCQVRCDGRDKDAFAHQADMDGHHLADKAGLDQFLHVHHGRIDAGLQADRGDESSWPWPMPPIPPPPPLSARAAIRNRRACPPPAPPWPARSATVRARRRRPRRFPPRRSSCAIDKSAMLMETITGRHENHHGHRPLFVLQRRCRADQI